MENAHPESTTEGQQTADKMQNDKDAVSRYVFTWRSKGLTADAKTIDEMIAALEGAADGMRLLKEAGVVLDAGTIEGDDACLVTTDPAVAQRFGFQREEAKEHDAGKGTEDQTQEGTGPK